MTTTNRKALIANIASGVPAGLGLRDTAKRNLAKMDDAALQDMEQKTLAIQAHGAKVRPDSAKLAAERAALSAKRKKAYAKLKRASAKVTKPAETALSQELAGPDSAPLPTDYETPFFVNANGVLDETSAIAGLARLHGAANSYDPDAVVSMAGGGEILGRFLATQSGIGRENYWVMNDDTKEFGTAFHSRAHRILLVNDVVTSGDKLCNAYDRLQHLNFDADIRIVVFVASRAAYSKLLVEGHSDAIIPNIVPKTKVKLPWDRDGEYKKQGRFHVFGFGSEDKLSVDSRQIEQISDSRTSGSVTS
jgi:hypothetical protein